MSCLVDFKTCLLGLLASIVCQGLKVLYLILDNSSVHAPKQLAGWIASLQLSSPLPCGSVSHRGRQAS
jgi:hypothetical protein